ncbi:type II secretion system F family protein [Agrococcus sp. HG114]|uniref:type II secretion system F family protein n=1 Tax=Agrococcus sp. HG114 TaxID=2969757 RepID=UPI00215A3769|nr:type II secretion system F family protein [Agrococcus sp. HG114]MCR8670692.1 type II secretion system F family protein [Agrococcus sp. HG114]
MTFELLTALIVALGIAVAAVVALDPGRVRLPRSRRRPLERSDDGVLAEAAEAATTLVGRLIGRRGQTLAHALDLAGLSMRPQDFAFLTAVAGIVVGALVLLLGGGWLSLVFAAIAPVAAVIVLRLRTERRRKHFALQLDSTLQLMASNLRAGYSTMQALASVTRDSEEPTATEFARAVNEARVGRPVVTSLEVVAERMQSEDFGWAVQAIAINREVGGSLAEVLDGVAATIRERGQIRRHVAGLSAEGRLSAMILMFLPFGVAGLMLLSNPGYLAPLLTSPIGIGMVIMGALLLLIGGIWMKKTVEVKF